MTISKFKVSALLCALCLLFGIAGTALAEVQLFIDANTVRVQDPGLGQPSVLNDFRTKGHRTHNNLALVWSENDAWVYDIRTHQWLSQGDFQTLLGSLSDNFALIWNANEAAVFDAKNAMWIRSEQMPWEINGALLSRGLAALTGEAGFVVYDPVLKEWQYANDFAVKKAQVGDWLAAAWDDNAVAIYDLTMHQWVLREGISPQACIIDNKKITVFTANTLYTYDAMSHRWSEKAR